MAARQFPGMALGWAVMFSALAAQAAPPPEQTVDQWADQHRQISGESGARITGQWSTRTTPYLRRPMRVAGVDHPAPSAWMRSSAKVGKTQVSLNVLAHCIDTAPRSAMVVLPKSDKVTDFNNKTWEPAVEATPKIAHKLLGTKSRSRAGSNKRTKRFRGGYLAFANAQVESELQSDDIGLLIFEEPSSYPQDTGGRGHPVDQARSRQDAWADDLKEWGSGTPAFVGACRVTDEVEARTQEKYYLPCPHCGAPQLLVWENRTDFEGRPHFTCQSNTCGALIGHEHKLAMLDAAWLLEEQGLAGWLACFESEDPENPAPPPCIEPEDWAAWYAVRGPDTGSKLERRHPSFDGIWQAYSPFTTWARIWEKFEAADRSGEPEDKVTFWQQVLGRPFEAAYNRPSDQLLFEKREETGRIAQLTRRSVPPWAWAVFGTVDLQGDRAECATWVMGRERRMARIDFDVVPISPNDPRCWDEIRRYLDRTYDGPHLKTPLGFDRRGIDTGGHHTSQAYAFCLRNPDVLALKGKPNDRDAMPFDMGTKRQVRVGRRLLGMVQLYLVGTHMVKKAIYWGLGQTLDSVERGELLPGVVMLEPEATERDFAQLSGEVLKPRDPSKKRKEETWEPVKGVRNEQLDLAVYAYALGTSFFYDGMTDKAWDEFIAKRRGPKKLPLEAVWERSSTPASGVTDAASPALASATPAPPPVDGAAGPGPDFPVSGGPNPVRRRSLEDHPLVAAARRARGDTV
ncbi:MAG: phage terminase large subunit family protein [Caulobacter sp.]|nr:phage terminase large subunit family protein [Caulobacter sp.]